MEAESRPQRAMSCPAIQHHNLRGATISITRVVRLRPNSHSPPHPTALGSLTTVTPTSGDKKIIATKVLGKVEWFNITH